mmetsp:Transcript_40817/g.80586  ORF Transcript_40817/g.80586 Transcript_40817/m.80586 type:complete len:328 (+) Transcript_40817:47-1030(+)
MSHGALRKHKWLILHHETMRSLAEKLQGELHGKAELGHVDWKHFDDGFPDVQLRKTDTERIEKYDGVCLLLSLHSPEVIFEQLSLLYELPSLRARNLRIVIPWFSTATMERVDQFGRIATAMSLARMLSICPCGPTGPATVITYDVHWLQEEFYFRDPLLVEFKTATSLFKDALRREREDNPDEEIVIAVDSADKHIIDNYSDFDQVICDTVRIPGTRDRVVKIKEGTPARKHCVIIDELVQSGSTLLGFADQLKGHGASKVSCVATHAIFARQSYKKFLSNSLIHKFWITDSVPTTAQVVEGQTPFVVLSLASLLSEYLAGSYRAC